MVDQIKSFKYWKVVTQTVIAGICLFTLTYAFSINNDQIKHNAEVNRDIKHQNEDIKEQQKEFEQFKEHVTVLVAQYKAQQNEIDKRYNELSLGIWKELTEISSTQKSQSEQTKLARQYLKEQISDIKERVKVIEKKVEK